MIVTQTNIAIANNIMIQIELSGTMYLEDVTTPVLIGNVTNNLPNKNLSFIVPIQTQYNNSQQNSYGWLTINVDGSILLDCPLFQALNTYTGSFNIQNTAPISYIIQNPALLDYQIIH